MRSGTSPALFAVSGDEAADAGGKRIPWCCEEIMYLTQYTRLISLLLNSYDFDFPGE